MGKRSKQKQSKQSRIGIATSVVLSSVIALTSISLIDSTESALSNSATTRLSVASDKLAPPTNFTVQNTKVGETDLIWKPSSTSYITGYRVLRSDNVYGPWTTLANLSKTATTYTDSTGGSKQWIYRVEAIYKNWLSESPGFESPPPVGIDFFDSFNGTAGALNGKSTDDGKSVWQVWAGEMTMSGNGWIEGSTTDGNGSVAVVRTPAQDATMFMNDVDGAERFVLRGKDPMNYIYVGGAAPPSGTWMGLFEIVEVRDGVKNVLMSGNTVTDNQDMRVEIKGSTITVWLQANKTNLQTGNLFTTVSSSFLLNDPTATYFGFGYSRSGFSIGDITFKAL